MAGFRFHYRLSGAPPTLETLPLRKAETLSEGDLVRLQAGEVAVAATGDSNLLGVAQEAREGSGPTTFTGVIVDSDAVYSVTDAEFRRFEDTLDLAGTTGAQGVGVGPNGDLAVMADSSPTEETLVRIGIGRHAYHRLGGGELNAALARMAVRLQKDYLGRGPTKAQAFFRGNVIVILMHNATARAERALAASGQRAAVLDMRRQLQLSMREELVAAVERLTGCKVTAFMSDNHIDPDMAAALFVLDQPVRGASVGG